MSKNCFINSWTITYEINSKLIFKWLKINSFRLIEIDLQAKLVKIKELIKATIIWAINIFSIDDL